MAESPTQRVVFQPAVYRAIQRGVHQIVEAVVPTLGPRSRFVAIDRADRGKPPELLDNGGVIARRIIGISDRSTNMGAMLVRHVLWRVQEQAGDGTATAAVLFRAIFDQGVRYVVSGGNAMQLREHLEEGARVILEELDGLVVTLTGKTQLAQLAETICSDALLAKTLGEVFDIIGEYGYLEIRKGRSRELEREYVEGMYWEGGVHSREMHTDTVGLRTEMQNAAILISDLDLEDPRQLLPVLEAVKGNGLHALLILAKSVSEKVAGLLFSANRSPETFRVLAVKPPGGTIDDQIGAMEDLAILTGGRPVVRVSGTSLAGVKLTDLGQARLVWANRSYFGIVGGKGDPRKLRAHIATLRSAHQRAANTETRQRFQKRIGKLLGGSAIVWIGAASELEAETRNDLASRTAEALRGAARGGVVPGGGVSLLACIPALQQRLNQSTDSEARAAYSILIKAMKVPAQTILENAGYDACEIMHQIGRAGRGYGFDVRSGKIVDMAAAGIWDVAPVLEAVVRTVVSGAATALTTDVLVHQKKPKTSMNP